MAGEDLLDGAELLIDEPMARRGLTMLGALAECMPNGSAVTDGYRGKHKLLVTYGVGLEQRMQARAAHLSRGGRVVMWDLGYWDREDAMRLSIDGFHPTAAMLERADGATRRIFTLRADADSEGHVLLIGMGRKSAQMLGLAPGSWEQSKHQTLAKRFPGREIRLRTKGDKRAGSIEDALKGCALVVCRHSNVAVDACIAGVPVECEDGAALALYGRDANPSPASRAEFLRRLSRWNWRPCEADQAWDWIQRITS